mgnify:CR=1 FL=1
MNCLVITSGQQPWFDFPECLVETIFLEEDRDYDFDDMMELVSHVFDDCNIWHYQGPDWKNLEGDIIFNPLSGDNSELIRAAELNEGFEGIDLSKV